MLGGELHLVIISPIFGVLFLAQIYAFCPPFVGKFIETGLTVGAIVVFADRFGIGA